MPQNKEYAINVPSNWNFCCTPSGFISHDIFMKWLKQTFHPFVKDRGAVCLTMDNHYTHVSVEAIQYCIDNEIDLLYLPANSTNILQPLDVGYFHVLKAKLERLVLSLGYAGALCLPRHEFPGILKAGLGQITPGTVQSAFRCVGFLPFDRTKVKAIYTPVTAPEDDPDVVPADQCPTCHQPTTSILVRAGMVPDHLKHILVPSPALKKKKDSPFKEARLIEHHPVIHAAPVTPPRIDAYSVEMPHDSPVPVEAQEEFIDAPEPRAEPPAAASVKHKRGLYSFILKNITKCY